MVEKEVKKDMEAKLRKKILGLLLKILTTAGYSEEDANIMALGMIERLPQKTP